MLNSDISVGRMQETVIDRFEAIAVKYGEYAAVTWERSKSAGGASSTDTKSSSIEQRRYRDLLIDAETISLRLTRGGLCVALWLERSYEMVASIMGVVLSGAAYVPMDIEAPALRLSELLADCSPKTVITLRRHTRDKKEISKTLHDRMIILADEVLSSEARSINSNRARFQTSTKIRPRSPLYVYYTSGSSGKPKGCVVPHCGLVNRVNWLQSRYALLPGVDCVLQKAFYGFGVSEWEIFWPLLHGATMALAAPGSATKDAEYLLQACARLNITRLFAVPSQLEALVDLATFSHVQHTKIKYILSAGEALSQALCKTIFEAFPGVHSIVNLYGPTEADMTYYELNRSAISTDRMVPAGYPIKNSLVRVVTEKDDESTTGEIIFYGEGIALGYAPHALELALSTQDTQKAKFFVDPDYGPAYRTGDLGYFDDTGCLHFVGRADRQVKVRGVRLELGEVESGLLTAGARAASAAVIGSGAAARLVAFYTTMNNEKKNDIIDRLRRLLPPHAIPSTLIHREAPFPLTANGKLDKKALLAELRENELNSNEDWLRAESDPLLHAVAEIWRSLLGVVPPSPDVAFESFGATSLSAGRCVAALRRTLGARVPVTAVFSHNTVHKLVQYLRDNNLVKNDDTSSATATSQIDNINNKEEHEKMRLLGLRVQKESTQVRCSSCTMSALICNALAFYVQSLLDFEAGLPAVIEFGVAYTTYSKYTFFKATVIASALFLIIFFLGLLVAAATKWLILGRAKPGSYAVFSGYYWRWLFVANIFQSAQLVARELGADTPLLPFVYTLFGAQVGKRCAVDGFMYDADMAQVGDDVEIGHDAVLSGHRITDGILTLQPYAVGSQSRIKTRAFVTAGAVLPSETELGSMATLDSLGLRGGAIRSTFSSPDFTNVNFSASQQLLRLFFGVPLVAILRQVPQGVAIVALSYCFHTDNSNPRALFQTSLLTVLATAWIYSFVASQAVFGLTVIFKRLLLPLLTVFCCIFAQVTYLPPLVLNRQTIEGHFAEFRYWLETRLVSSAHFESCLGIWINTEVLSILFRCLGASVGSKVQIDAFYAVDHSAVTIGNDVVFGHGVTIDTSEVGVPSSDILLDSDEDDTSASGSATPHLIRTTKNSMMNKENGSISKAVQPLSQQQQQQCEMVSMSQQQEQRPSRRRSRQYHQNPCEQFVSPRSNLGAVFGSCLRLLSPRRFFATSSEEWLLAPEKRPPIRRKKMCLIENEAQVLDHCHLEPGVRVREKALLGSTTLIPQDYIVAPGTTSMGNVNGEPVILRHASVSPKPLTEIEQVARSRHDSFFAWTSFNLWNISCALALESLQTSVWLLAATWSYQLIPTWGIYLLVFPVFDFLLQLVETLCVAAIKWIFIGRYEAGDHAFYGRYHYQWACMLLLHRSTKAFFEKIRGTCTMNGIFRIFGAQVGTDCCLLSSTVEFDLCRFKSQATVGFHAVIQPHTVENLVIKLGPFDMGPSSSIAHLAAIMPDTGLEHHAILLENSLLPKGCLVQAETIWAGLPASELDASNLVASASSGILKGGSSSSLLVASRVPPEEELLLASNSDRHAPRNKS